MTRSKHPASNGADDLLADRFAVVKGGVLAHVAEIGRDEHKPPGAAAPQRFGGKQQRESLSFGRSSEA